MESEGRLAELERFKALLDQSCDVILLAEAPAGHLVDANESTLRQLGYSRQELFTLSLSDLVPLATVVQLKALLCGERPPAGKEAAITTELHSRDGDEIPVEMTVQLVTFDHALYTVVVARIVTLRKQAREGVMRRAQEMAALYETSLEINAKRDLPMLLHAIVRRAAGLVHARMGGLYLMMPDKQTLELVVSYNLPGDPTGTRLRLGEGLSGRIARTGEPMTVSDYQHWEGRAAVYEGDPFRRVVGVPLKVGERVIGVLDITDDERTGTFSEEEIRLVSLFADQAAIAVENSRLLQAEREQRELAQALEEAAVAISSSLEMDEVLDRILEQVERVIAGDAFNIMLIEEGAARKVRWRGYENLNVDDPVAPYSVPVFKYQNLSTMVQTGRPFVSADTANDPRWIKLENQEWIRSYVGAPVRVGKVTVGFLNVYGTRVNQFDSADARRLEGFASHAATAIENAQLYQEVHAYAADLEQRVQKRTAQLQAQYARLEAILRSVTDGIVVADAKGRILQTNPIAHDWLNRTLSPEDAARLREAVRDLARQAQNRPEKMLELTGLDLELTAAPVLEPRREETAAVVSIHDVTHLRVLDRMKSRFVSYVSHELRTPITAIKLYGELMRRRPEQWQNYLDILVGEADSLARLVEGILQVSRVDAGRLEVNSRLVPLNKLTRAAIGSHQSLAEEKGLTLDHRPAEPGPVALVDPELIIQVLSNLLGNAIRYTSGGGDIIISTGTEEVDGRAWATATVTDTGMGIPEQELPHIFDRFFRGEQAQMMQISGTGLGLAIARDIVELHGGQMIVESEVDVGTTFTIRLPLGEQ